MRKLWNRAALPVWSLVTCDTSGKANMNICTYVTAVSMEPKRMMIAVYHGTKTRENIQIGNHMYLQLLAHDQAPLVRLLGQQSGNTKDKLKLLRKRRVLDETGPLPRLIACAGYLEVEALSIHDVGGDHDLLIVSVIAHKNLRDVPVLTTDMLREERIIR